MKDFNISTGLVVVPFAHLLLASTFLYAYCLGFGAHVATFVAVSDIFSTSIRSLAPLYAIMVVSALFASWREIKNWVATGDPFPTPTKPGRAHAAAWFSNKWVLLIKAVFLFVTFFPLLVNYTLGLPMDFFLAACAAAMCLLFSDWMVRARGTAPVQLSIISVIAIAIAVVAGINTGQQNRHASFIEMAENNSTCGNYVVIRRFSDMYLALGRDGQHRMIDKDCKPQFSIPRVKPGLKVSDLPVAFRWMFEVPAKPSPKPAHTPPVAPLPKPATTVTTTTPVPGTLGRHDDR